MGKKIVLGIVCVLAILFFLIPTFISYTGPLTFESHAFQIRVEKISASWFGPIVMENIRGKSAERGINFDIDSVESNQGLLDMLTSFSLGTVAVDKPVVYFQPLKPAKTTAPTKESEEEDEAEKPTETEDEPLVLPLQNLTVREGSIRVINKDGSVTRIDHTNLQLKNDQQMIQLQAEGSSSEGGEKGSFQLEAAFDQKESKNICFIPVLPVHLQAEVVDFPTKVLDETLRVFNRGTLNLQELIGPTIDFSLQHQDNRYLVEFHSEYLKGGGNLEQEGGIFKAVKPLAFNWEITPAALNPLLQKEHLPLQLTEMAHVQFSLFDLIGNPIECKSSFRLHIEPASFVFPENGSVLKLENFDLESQVDLPKDKKEIAGLGQFYFNGTPFQINVEAQTELEVLHPVHLEVQANKIPTRLIELLLHAKHSLEEPLGPNVSLAFLITQKGGENLLGVQIKNKAFSSQWIQFSLHNGVLRLKKPVQLEFKPLGPIEFTVSDETHHLNFIQPLKISLNQAIVREDFKSSSFDLELSGEQLTVDHYPFTFLHYASRLEKKKGRGMNVQSTTDLQLQNPRYLGEHLRLKSFAHLDFKNNGWEIYPLDVQAESPLLKFSAKVKIDEEMRLYPLSTIQARYLVGPNLLPQITQPAHLDLNLFASDTAIDLLHLEKSRFKGNLTGTTLKVQENPYHTIALENLEAAFEGNLSQDELLLALHANTGPGAIDANIEVTNFYEEGNGAFSLLKSCFSGKVTFDRFPSLFLSPFFPNERYFFLLGKQFDATVEGAYICSQHPNGLISFHFHNEHFDAASYFKMDAKTIKIQSNPEEENLIRVHLSEQAAKLLNGEINSPLSARIVIDYLSMPNPIQNPVSLGEFVDRLEGIGSIHVEPSRIDHYTVPPLIGGFEFPVREPIELHLQQKGNPDLRFECTIERPLSLVSHWSELNIKALFKGKSIPILYLAQQFAVEPILLNQIETLFDNSAEIDVQMDLNESEGPIDLKVLGKNCTLDAAFYIEEEQIKLQKNLEAKMHVTPSIGKFILGEIVPLLASVTSANGDIKLVIEPEGFTIPIKNWKELSFDRGILDLGILTLSMDQEIADILNFLKYSGGTEVQIWATPIYFAVESEVVKLDRFDFLVANRFPLALWGKIDFLKERADLKLGLGAKTLDQVFDIQNLPSDFMLTLSLKGPLNDISLDKAKATAKIAALVAENKGSAEGVLLGNLLELFSGSFKEESAPPPTTTPLPWERH